MKITLPIDVKSLHMNIKNDNLKGHTPTVSTVIKQGKSVNLDLMQVYRIPNKEIDVMKYPSVEEQLLKNSKSIVKIEKVYYFNKFSVNGKPFDCDSSFGIFVKKEIDETKAQFGRIKLHYPMSLSFEADNVKVDNKKVLKALSSKINDYAFLVKAFEYDLTTDILNFNVVIIGDNEVPYSKVFVNNKGVGNKYITDFYEHVDDYDIEILNLKKIFDSDVDTSNYNDYILKERSKAINLACEYLENNGYEGIFPLCNDFPYSMYDIEYIDNGIKKYVILGYSASNIKYFNLSNYRIRFMHLAQNDLKFFMFNNIFSNVEFSILDYSDILGLNREVTSMKFYEV